MDATEIYLLCDSRSADLAKRFLDACLPMRRPVADEFPFPEFVDDTTEVFRTPEEIMRRLEQVESESYSLYWDAVSDDGPRQVMLFYTDDGAMIAGIGGPDRAWEDVLTSVGRQVNGRFGYVTSGSRPPESVEEFNRICRQSTLVSLYDGQLRAPMS